MSICSIRYLLSVALLIAGTVGCSEKGLSLRDAWVSEAPPNAAAQAGYLTIDNGTDQQRTLIGAASTTFESIEFHRTVYDKSTSMARMIHEKQLEIAPQTELRFEPGSYHLMLMNPKKSLRDGDKVPMTLLFADGAQFRIEFAVRREVFAL